MHDAVKDVINRRVSVDEVRRELTRPIPVEERDDVLALVKWFTTRYPSPESRLAYVRLAYTRWRATRMQP